MKVDCILKVKYELKVESELKFYSSTAAQSNPSSVLAGDILHGD